MSPIIEHDSKVREGMSMITGLLAEHGLEDWRVELKNVRSYLAKTQHQHKRFVFNVRGIRAADREMMIGITMHEIAHALVGPGIGHGRKFKQKLYELTGSYEFSMAGKKLDIKDFFVSCNGCSLSGTTNDNSKPWCRRCFNTKGEQTALVFVPNPVARRDRS